jgi:hypothetical protein
VQFSKASGRALLASIAIMEKKRIQSRCGKLNGQQSPSGKAQLAT